MRFIHGCYVYSHKLAGRVQLNQTRFDQFNVIYLMGYPIWSAEDFLYPSADVDVRLGGGYRYPSGDTGRALTPDFIDRAQRSGVKVLLCIQDGFFLPVCKDPAARQRFIESAVAFIQRHNYDGLEIDWEENVDVALHTDLMERLRARLNALQTPSRPLLLVTAVLAGKKYPPDLAQRLHRSVDWINVMTYDLGGALYGTAAVHNAGLDQFKHYAEPWAAVFGPQKICLGLANYGYLYRGLRPGQKISGSLRSVGRSLHYNELPPLLAAGWREAFDRAAMAPYYFSPSGNDFATMDNAQSLRAKMDWLVPRGYRGVFWWEFQCDFQYAPLGSAAAIHPLIDPVEQQLRAAID